MVATYVGLAENRTDGWKSNVKEVKSVQYRWKSEREIEGDVCRRR